MGGLKKRVGASPRQGENLDRRLQDWLDADTDDEDEETEETLEADFWDRHSLVQPEISLMLYRLYLAFDGQHLPWRGALVDQPDWWLHDVNIIAARRAQLKKRKKASEETMSRLERIKQQLEQRRRGRS